MALNDQLTYSAPIPTAPSVAASPYTTGFERYRVSWKVWVVWLIFFFMVAAVLPRDAHFDVAHYHVHNGWSVWADRIDRDLAPAELHSFMNPVHSGFVWLLIDNLPGPLAIGLLGLVQALILPALYALIARIAFALDVDTSRSVISIIAAVGFLTQPMSIMTASVLNDHWGALAFICALALVVGRDRRPPSRRALACASLFLGLMLGLKVTNAVYVPAFAVAVIIAVPGLADRLRAIAVCSVAGVAGLLATGGWWGARMWQKFGNPVFPHLNSVFGSPPEGPDEPFRDPRYLPDGLGDAILRPFAFSFDGALINEYHVYDFRFLLGYVCSFLVLGLLALQVLRKQPIERARPVLILVASFLTTMLVWSLVFSIQRYAMALWLLGPAIFCVLIWYARPDAFSSRNARLGVLSVLGAITVTTTYEPLRRAPWASVSEPYVWTQLPEEVDVRGAVIIMSSYYPTAFTSPAFSDAAWITHADARPWSKPALENYRPRIKEAIGVSNHRLFAVMAIGQDSGEDDLIRLSQDYNLRAEFSTCSPMKTAFDSSNMSWAICPLYRRSALD